MTGVLPALGAASAFAVFQVVNARALTRTDVARGTRMLLATAALALGAITLVTDGAGPWIEASPRALLMAAAAGMVHFGLGWTFLGTAQQRIGAARAGALVGTVPLFGSLVAWATLGEAVGPVQFAGLLLVVVGVGVIAMRNRNAAAAPRALSGVAAALGTATCWSISPVLIREALAGIPSPRAAATVGLLASALLHAALLAAARRGREHAATDPRALQLLAAGGTLVALALWMQWTAFSLAPVATVLVLLQLTPALVPVLARIGGTAAGDLPLVRIYLGVAAIVVGSLPVILLD